MLRFSTKLILVLPLLVLFTGCASILNSRTQKLTLETNDSNTKLYVDNIETPTNSEYYKAARDGKTHQVKVEMDGYKSEYYALFQEKRSPLYIMSWIPFGIFYLVPPLMDNGPKAFNFAKEHQFDIKQPITRKADDEKYIYLNNTAIDIQGEDLQFAAISWKNYKSGNTSSKMMYQGIDEEIKVSNSIFADILNDFLLEQDYADTTESIFQSKTNTLYISSTITEIEILQVRNGRACNFIEADISMTWQLEDIYKQKLYSSEIQSKSGQFSWHNNSEPVQMAIEDAVTSGFLTFLAEEGVQEFKKLSESQKIDDFEELTLGKPSKGVQSLSEAMESTFTILSKEGHGSGFLVSTDGYLLSNFHVVANATDLKARNNNGEDFPIEVIRANEQQDLALLKIDYQSDVSFLLPEERNFKIGQEIYAIGTPTSIELGNSLSKGIVSSVRKVEGVSYIQTDVSISPGNSGGPIVNQDGQLTGIVNSKLIGFGVEGIAFGTPGELILDFLKITY